MKENPSRSYWKEREEQVRKERAKREKGYQEEIKEIYEDMLDDVQKEIDSFYAKYAKKEGISIAEAKKRASKLDIEEYARKAKKYVKSKDFSKEANEDMRRHMEPFIIDVMPTEDTDFVLSSHEGEEFIMVMEGIMEISYGKNTYLLEEGDSIYYDSIVPHHVHAYEGQAAKILAVVYTPI